MGFMTIKKWQALLLILGLVGFALSLSALLGCSFLLVTIPGIPHPDAGPNVTLTLTESIGYFSHRTPQDDSCVWYENAWKTNNSLASGRAVAILVCVLCAMIFVMHFLSLVDGTCFHNRGLVGILYLAALLFQALPFLICGTAICPLFYRAVMGQRGLDVYPVCEIGGTADYAIAACVVYFWAGVQAFKMPWPGGPLFGADRRREEEQEEDGVAGGKSNGEEGKMGENDDDDGFVREGQGIP